MAAEKKAKLRGFTEDEKGILRRALSRHYHHLMKAADLCGGVTYARIYESEAERTEILLKRLLGVDEHILQKG